MRKCDFVSLAVGILLVVGFTTCQNTANQSGGKTLTGLEISSPVDTEYSAGQLFDKTDLVVTATYKNKKPKDVTDKCKFEPGLTTPLNPTHTAIVISYTEDGFTLKAYHGITVNPAGTDPVITVSPAAVIVGKGENKQFSVSVSNADVPSTVTWTVEGNNAAGTSITTEGLLTVAAGETATTLTVKATSTVAGYTHIFGTAAVTVASPPPQGAVVVVPSTATVRRGETFQFNVTIAGVAASNTDVIWEIPDDPWSPPTNISPSGLLTVNAGNGNSGFTVKATSKADPTQSATAAVTLTF